MEFTKEELKYIFDTLLIEVEIWEDGCRYVEYEMSEKSYNMSKRIIDKIKPDSDEK